MSQMTEADRASHLVVGFALRGPIEVVHGHLGRLEIEAQSALVAAGLGLQRSIGQPLDLELTPVRRELAPPAYTALVLHAERSSDCGLGAVVADNIRGLHDR